MVNKGSVINVDENSLDYTHIITGCEWNRSGWWGKCHKNACSALSSAKTSSNALRFIRKGTTNATEKCVMPLSKSMAGLKLICCVAVLHLPQRRCRSAKGSERGELWHSLCVGEHKHQERASLHHHLCFWLLSNGLKKHTDKFLLEISCWELGRKTYM